MLTEPEKNSTEESGFEKFASQALRLHRKGSFELLLSQHLAVATPSDPLVKVRLTCESAWMVPQDKLKLDMQQVETIYMTCLSFLNTNTFKVDSVSIAFGFEQTEENYERFIKPWHKGVPLAFVFGNLAERQSEQQALQQAESEAEKFFLYTTEFDLSLGSFQMLKTEFLKWAIPQCMEIFEKLSRLIDPDLYKEMLGILKPDLKSEEE